MDFETVSEPFSVYIMPDGRRMRVKHILTEVTQTGVDSDGHAMWNVQFTPVIAIEPTPEQNARIIEQAKAIQAEAAAQQPPARLVKRSDLQ